MCVIPGNWSPKDEEAPGEVISGGVISYESLAGPGFQGRAGYLASWRPVYEGRGAIRIAGSPFKNFDEAKAACDAMLKHLTSD